MSLQERLYAVEAPVAVPAAEPEPTPVVVTRAVDPFAELKQRIHHSAVGRLGTDLNSKSPEEQERIVLAAVIEELQHDATPLTRDERTRVAREITDDVLGYGPLQPLLADDDVTEIMVNGPYQVYVERDGRLEPTNVAFANDEHLMRIIDKIVSQVGRRIDEASPMVDARLPDGSRVNAIIPPLSLRGAALTIRKFGHDPFALNDLVGFGSITERAADFLAACVRGKLNVLVAGGSGVGKTTLLNALSSKIPADERIVTIEDSAELQLQQAHVLPLESRPPNVEGRGEIRIRELVRNALRMRPDRIIVGEVRGPETVDMLQAMNTGHDGSLSTIHSNSPRDALARLETLVLTAGVELPLRAIREQIASAFDLIVYVTRLVDGSRRVTHITEVLGLEGDVITLQDLFHAPKPDLSLASTELLGELVPTGLQPSFLSKLAANGVTVDPALLDPNADLAQPVSLVGRRS
ncbi:MAG: CpaF family protein [Actinobacteria bacterium]|nr:CpaF family protein [Actinomycetota bacterium]